MKTHILPTVVLSTLVFTFTQLQAQTQRIFTNSGTGNDWSNSDNWSADAPTLSTPANGNGDWVQLNANGPNVNSDRTVNRIQSNFGQNGDITVSGGLLTIDRNSTSALQGIRNSSGQALSNLIFSGNVEINNTLGGITTFDFTNTIGDSNITFSSTSTLTITTLTRIDNGSGGTFNFNGTLGASSSNIQINSSNTNFGVGHDSSSFGRDFVLLTGGKIGVNGGTVLNINRKFQVNGNGEIELNAADAINNANFVTANAFTLILDANTDQSSLGFVGLGNGSVLSLELDAGVSLLSFADTSSQNWGTGTVSITGFRPGVIQFGTNSSGLSAGQLSAIDGGAYSIDSNGFLIPEPGTITLMVLFGTGLMIFRRKKS